jgi:hypothetical protein
MEATLKMKEVMELLKKRYTNQFTNIENIDVKFDLYEQRHVYHDLDNTTESYTTKEVQAIISYDKKFNGIMIRCKVAKLDADLTKDIIDELSKVIGDEYKIDYIIYPKKSLNDNGELTVIFHEKNKTKKLVK